MVLLLTETNGSTQTFTNPFFSGSASSTPFTVGLSNTNTNANYNPFSNSNNYGSGSNNYYGSGSSNNYYGSGSSNNYGSGSSNNYGSGSNPYSSVLPSGIPRSQIPQGSEDLYILKSEVIPPVCPACPSTTVCPSSTKDKPPPCPPCARCPEPNFTCKKVPNYGASDYSAAYYGSSGGGGFNDDYDEMSSNYKSLPVPVLSDFSTFGM
jgi:hypothetical protein